MTDPEGLPPGVAGNPSAAFNPSAVGAQHGAVPNTVDMQFSSMPPVLMLTPASHHLLAHARLLATQGHHQFAVVFAHAACELHTEGELIRLVSARSDKLLGELVLPGEREIKSLTNTRVYRVYSALTDDYPAGCSDPKRPAASWWGRWNASRQDRHRVAHKGAQMTREQADEAIDVTDEYIKHVTQKVEAALVRSTP